jgi:hypothetical protein
MNNRVELKQVIITNLDRYGKGEEGSPIRRVIQVWDAETGELVATNDPCAPVFNLASGKYEVRK